MTLAPIRPPFPRGARGHQLRWNQDAGAPEWGERPPFDVREYGPWEQGTSAGVVAPSGAAKQVRVELSRALTATLAPGQYDAQVIATLAGGAVVTLIEAVLVVKPRRGEPAPA